MVDLKLMGEVNLGFSCTRCQIGYRLSPSTRNDQLLALPLQHPLWQHPR